MMLQVMQQCMDDPRQCDCSGIPVKDAQAECEKGKALAIRCEFKQEMEACDELDEMDTKMISSIPAPLRPFFKQKFMALKEKKEKEMMKKFAPPECIEAGVTTRQECEDIMMRLYAPPECIEAGATTKEACEEIMTPPECKERGVYDRYECEKIMMEIHGAPPQECLDAGGHFIGEKECNAIMMPTECIEAGATTEQECMMLMTPPECKAAGAFDRESCEKIMIKLNVPPECVINGEPVTPEECNNIMMNKYAPPECITAGAATPEECEKIMGDMLPGECKERGLGGEECHTHMMIPQECKEAGITDKASCEAFMQRIYEKEVMLEEPNIKYMPEVQEFVEYEERLPPKKIIPEYDKGEMEMPGIEMMVMGYGGGEMLSNDEVDQMLVESEAVQMTIQKDLEVYEEKPSELVQERVEHIEIMETQVERVAEPVAAEPVPEPSSAETSPIEIVSEPAPEPVEVSPEPSAAGGGGGEVAAG